jgi:hypothetical protein
MRYSDVAGGAGGGGIGALEAAVGGSPSPRILEMSMGFAGGCSEGY